ncbi:MULTISPECIES: hypothetical protein [Nocardiopsis]|uniref:Uncharacterized protein n=1 Tax=Nocardiopsis sinuspersici TaxID=501010 RepID=A0A1V3C1G9_9ACTN|nr:MULTISPECIES: hypothetical protein [Nocardiopsis]OOC54346.1 hypothetical protein NOSIN_11470 [Nocardiopsis sinuspersici]
MKETTVYLRGLALFSAAAALAAGIVLTPESPDPATAAPVAAEQAEARSAAETTTVRYGPFAIPAATSEDHGHEGGFLLDVEKPCEDCHITGFKPDLVYTDGSNANIDTGPMLHHAVLFNSRERDTVCRGPQRVFATGNERVESVLPSGYGAGIGSDDQWMLNYDLMNHGHEEKTVYVEFTFTHEPVAGSGITPVTPLWLDVGGCSGSEYEAPEGVSEESRLWRSTVSGDLVHVRGHLHHGGTALWLENLSRRSTLCHIDAEEGGSPEFVDHHGRTEISDMPPCGGDPIATVRRGDYLRITSRYELTGHSHDGVMGIMVGWIAER